MRLLALAEVSGLPTIRIHQQQEDPLADDMRIVGYIAEFGSGT